MFGFVQDDPAEPARRVDSLTDGTNMVQSLRAWVHPSVKSGGANSQEPAAKEEDFEMVDAPGEVANADEVSNYSSSTKSSRRSSYDGPARLTRFTPPENFGSVIDGKVFRSGYPAEENFGYLKWLKLKSILTLVKEECPKPYVKFIAENGIHHFRVHIPANKGVISITTEAMVQALTVVLDRNNYPLLIHCNKGKHRTGCVVACLGKVLGRRLGEIKEEYHTYADPKARSVDEQFIDHFDERSVLWVARLQGWLLDDEPRSPISSIIRYPWQPA